MALWKKKSGKPEASLEEIRDLYNQYIVEYGKTDKVRRAFEDRYMEALRQRKSLRVFFSVEKELIEERIAKAAAERQESWNEAVEEVENGPEESYGDRVVRQLKDRMAAYQAVEIHPDAMEDVERLFGAVGLIYDQWWASLAAVVKGRTDYALKQEYRNLDEELYRLTGTEKKLPEAAVDYQQLLARGAGEAELGRRVREIFLRGARFLHRLDGLLGELREAESSGLVKDAGGEKVQEEDFLAGMQEAVQDMVANFRLQDLGRQ